MYFANLQDRTGLPVTKAQGVAGDDVHGMQVVSLGPRCSRIHGDLGGDDGYRKENWKILESRRWFPNTPSIFQYTCIHPVYI